MKNVSFYFLAVIILFSLVSCSNIGSAKIDYGESNLYSLEERKMVANMIAENFEEEKSKGFILKKIEFAGDLSCSNWLNTYKKQDNKEYDGCIVFILTVSVPKDYIFYSEGKIRDYCNMYVKEPGGEWYFKDSGW